MRKFVFLLPFLILIVGCGSINDLTPAYKSTILKPNYEAKKDSSCICLPPITRQQRLAQNQTQKNIRKMYLAESKRIKRRAKEVRKKSSDSLDFLISHYEILIDQIKLEKKEEIKRLRLYKRMYSDSIKGANKSLKTAEKYEYKKEKKSYSWVWMLICASIVLILIVIILIIRK